jgi:hypothetical protein
MSSSLKLFHLSPVGQMQNDLYSLYATFLRLLLTKRADFAKAPFKRGLFQSYNSAQPAIDRLLTLEPFYSISGFLANRLTTQRKSCRTKIVKLVCAVMKMFIASSGIGRTIALLMKNTLIIYNIQLNSKYDSCIQQC